jgi:hypothetical protein
MSKNTFIYNKSIIWELINNNDFIKIEIKKNKIFCDNELIKADIEKKLKLTIEHVEFFASVYDYKIRDSNYFWNNIKNLPNSELPIYFKDMDLNEYLQWLNKEINNNNARIYETSKITKREFVFDNKDKCKATVKWENTNYKFDTFNQLFYHAGDFDDLERYGYIYIRTEYKNIKNIKKDELSKNAYIDKPIQLWNKYNTDMESIKNTMKYMMNKMKKGIFVAIKNNKLLVFLPFSKYDYINDFYTELYFDDDDKRMLREYKKNPNKFLQIKLQKKVLFYLNKYRLGTKNINLDREKWIANDCFFRYENYEGDKAEAVFEDFLVNLCENRILPDSIFIINIRDHPVLNKDLKDSYTSIIDRDLDEKYKFDNWCPIVSVGPSKDNADIPFITQDDWLRTSKKLYPDDCGNGYIQPIDKVEWKDKINKGIFRGSATGCEMGESNVRIKASIISKENPKYLDAGVVSFNRKLKKRLNEPLKVMDSFITKANFMTLNEKVRYKYILNLEGHVAAFRLGHEFSLGSVILIPESNYYLWFSYLLVPFEHYVPVKGDLSDLIEKIKWCIDNDDKCYTIAQNGVKFFDKYLDKNGIFDYVQNLLYQIQPINLNLKSYDKNIAIVTIFRNDKLNTRLQQLRLYIYWMNKILKNICNYDIIVVEQTVGEQFNIGKLKNVGFDYLINEQKKSYDNIIFSDIDTIPDTNLLEYFFKITDSLNSLANLGTRYESPEPNSKFTGALISTTSAVYKELNGYPNNFWGWGDEDVNLILRLSELNKPLYANANGKIIDIEEIDNKKKDISTKITELNENKLRENFVYEKNSNYKNFKNNGLSNINYTIKYESSYTSNYHIIVDLEKKESERLYPQDHFFDYSINKDDYRKMKNDAYRMVKKILF